MKFGLLCMRLSLVLVLVFATNAAFGSDDKNAIRQPKSNGELHLWFLPALGIFLGHKSPVACQFFQRGLINTQQRMGYGTTFRDPELVKQSVQKWSGLSMKMGFGAGCFANMLHYKKTHRTA